MYLYHYYDKSNFPFLNLSDISTEEANKILDNIRKTKPQTLCAKRNPNYMELRLYYEEILRAEFLKKGGIIKRNSPHYMVVEHSPWLYSWYENADFIKRLLH